MDHLPRLPQIAEYLNENPDDLWKRRLPYYQKCSSHIFPIDSDDLKKIDNLNSRWINWVKSLLYIFNPRPHSHFACFNKLDTHFKLVNDYSCCQAVEIRADLLPSQHIN